MAGSVILARSFQKLSIPPLIQILFIINCHCQLLIVNCQLKNWLMFNQLHKIRVYL